MQKHIIRRCPEIISAISLSVAPNGKIYWNDYEADLERTIISGLPKLATCMDTTQVHGLSNDMQLELVKNTANILNDRVQFIAGVIGNNGLEYMRKIEAYEKYGANCIIFPPSFLKNASCSKVVKFYKQISSVSCGNLLAFELSPAFISSGWFFPKAGLEEIMCMPKYVGMKHSSLNVPLLLQLASLRDKVNKKFKIYSGDDYNIGKSIIYGFDCLLGAATLFPEKFAEMAGYWSEGNKRKFYEIEEKLQLLMHHIFEPDIKAYRYSINKAKQILGLYKYDNVLSYYPKRNKVHIERLKNFLRYVQS